MDKTSFPSEVNLKSPNTALPRLLFSRVEARFMRHVACSSPDSKSQISELNESFSFAPFSYSADDWQFAITKGSNWRLIYSRFRLPNVNCGHNVSHFRGSTPTPLKRKRPNKDQVVLGSLRIYRFHRFFPVIRRCLSFHFLYLGSDLG
jgi:hypothetical protein